MSLFGAAFDHGLLVKLGDLAAVVGADVADGFADAGFVPLAGGFAGVFVPGERFVIAGEGEAEVGVVVFDIFRAANEVEVEPAVAVRALGVEMRLVSGEDVFPEGVRGAVWRAGVVVELKRAETVGAFGDEVEGMGLGGLLAFALDELRGFVAKGDAVGSAGERTGGIPTDEIHHAAGEVHGHRAVAVGVGGLARREDGVLVDEDLHALFAELGLGPVAGAADHQDRHWGVDEPICGSQREHGGLGDLHPGGDAAFIDAGLGVKAFEDGTLEGARGGAKGTGGVRGHLAWQDDVFLQPGHDGLAPLGAEHAEDFALHGGGAALLRGVGDARGRVDDLRGGCRGRGLGRDSGGAGRQQGGDLRVGVEFVDLGLAGAAATVFVEQRGKPPTIQRTGGGGEVWGGSAHGEKSRAKPPLTAAERQPSVEGQMKTTIKVLTIRQPWAWLIVNGHKDVENRSWDTKFRGRFMVHAAVGIDPDFEAVRLKAARMGIEIPPRERIDRGGIVGAVELVETVTESESPWWEGPVGFVLRAAKKLPFEAMKGRLGWWSVERTGEI